MGQHGTPVMGTLEKYMMASSSFFQRFMQEKCKDDQQTAFHCQMKISINNGKFSNW